VTRASNSSPKTGSPSGQTILGGLLASVTSPGTAMAVAGLLILATPLLLPRHEQVHQQERPSRSPAVTLAQGLVKPGEQTP